MDPKKIILSVKPGLLGEMIKRAFLHNPDLQIVGETTNVNGLSTLIRHTEAEWVLVTLSQDGEFPVNTKNLLDKHPKLGVLAISMDGSKVKLRWFSNHEKKLDNPTLEKIISILFAKPGRQPELS